MRIKLKNRDGKIYNLRAAKDCIKHYTCDFDKSKRMDISLSKYQYRAVKKHFLNTTLSFQSNFWLRYKFEAGDGLITVIQIL